jgi:hypothetical protein
VGRAVRLSPAALLVLLVAVALLLVAKPAAAAPESPTAPQDAATPATPAQTGIPAGCPGGPEGVPSPGTECPDGSIPGLPPTGCAGGPEGLPRPGTRCPDGSVPVAPTAPAGCPGGLPDEPEVDTICPDGSAPRDREADRRVRNILGIDGGVEHPMESYDIGCDEGSWNAFLRKMWCGFQSWPFAVGKWFIGTGTNLLEWALEFRVVRVLTPLAGALSDVYDASLVGGLHLRSLAWLLTGLVGGWNIMQARFGNGFREILTTWLVAVLAGFLFINPAGYLQGTVRLTENLSGVVLQAVDETMTPGESSGAEGVRERVTTVFTRSFVAEPYDLINWGGPLTGQCAAARDRILDGGPWGSDDRPRELMREAGCTEEADFNAKPTDERAAASLTVAGASIVITVLMMLIALAVLTAQVTLIALFAGASVVWTLALMPGNRAILWWWVSRLFWSVIITVASFFMLSWISITTTAVLNATADMSIVQRCLIVLVIVAVAYRFRSALDRGIEGAARNFNRSGRRATTQGPGPAAGAGFAAFGAGAALVGAGAVKVAARTAAPAAAAGAVASRGPLSVRPRQLTTAAIAGAGTATAMGRRGGRVVVTGAQQVRTVGGTAARGSAALGAATIGRRAATAMPGPGPGPNGGSGGGGSGPTARSEGVRGRIRQARDTQRRWMKTARNPVSEARRTRDAADRIRQETHEWM